MESITFFLSFSPLGGDVERNRETEREEINLVSSTIIIPLPLPTLSLRARGVKSFKF
jgi:hypothetical protein